MKFRYGVLSLMFACALIAPHQAAFAQEKVDGAIDSTAAEVTLTSKSPVAAQAKAEVLPAADSVKASGALAMTQARSAGVEKSPEAEASSVKAQSPETSKAAAKDAASDAASTSKAVSNIKAGKSSQQEADSAPAAAVKVRSHAEGSGITKWKSAEAGSAAQVGKGSERHRVNAIQVKVDSDYRGSVEYQGYALGEGWTTVKRDGAALGSASSSEWLEGLRMSLTGKVSRNYDLEYRVRMLTGDWQAWKSNGALAGVTDDSAFIKCVQVRLLEKEKESKSPAKGLVGITYRAHLDGAGMQARRADGASAGDEGTADAIDALEVSVGAGSAGGGVEYRAFVNDREWSAWTPGGTAIGKAAGRGSINALQVRLTGGIAEKYDVMYRSAPQGGSWQPWVANGGTTGRGGEAPISAVQVKLEKKGRSYKIAEGTYVITRAENQGHELCAKGSGLGRAAFSTGDARGKFYIREEKGGVSLQSAANGKFVTAGSAPSLKAWAGSANQIWEVAWDGGLRFKSAGTGEVLGLARKGYLNGAGSGLMLRSARLIGDGTYTVKNFARLMTLDLAGGSWGSGANIQVYEPNRTGNQAFDVAYVGGGCYTIVNTMTGGAVSVDGASKAPGANVVQRRANGAAKSQQWRASMDRTGSYYFVNRASGGALTARSGGRSGGNVASYKNKGVETQRWWLERTSWRFTGNRDLDRFLYETAAENGYDLRECFDWMGNLTHVQSVDSRLHWGIVDDDVSLSYVEIARDREVADCYTDAGMFCWLARACGYEANMRAGGCPSASSGTVPHGWTEVYVDGVTYVCDANLRRDLPSYNWYMVTYASAPVEYTL